MSIRRFCQIQRPITHSILHLKRRRKNGVTIMLMDAKIDNGSILASQKLKVESQNLNAKELEEKLAELGGQMLVDAIPKWINGKIKAKEQDHNQATFTEKLPRKTASWTWKKILGNNLQKISLAFQPWPGIYYFTQKKRPQNPHHNHRYGIIRKR